MRQVQFPVTVDIHGNLVDNTGEIVAKPVEGYEDVLTSLVHQVVYLDDITDVSDIATL